MKAFWLALKAEFERTRFSSGLSLGFFLGSAFNLALIFLVLG